MTLPLLAAYLLFSLGLSALFSLGLSALGFLFDLRDSIAQQRKDARL